MALEATIFVEQTGAAYTNAYAKITSFRGNRTLVIYDVAVYADAKARADSRQPVTNLSYDIPYDVIAAALAQTKQLPLELLYADLKSRAAFEASKDV